MLPESQLTALRDIARRRGWHRLGYSAHRPAALAVT